MKRQVDLMKRKKKYRYLIQQKIKPIIGLIKCADLYKKTGNKALALKFYKKANDLADPRTPMVEHIAMGFIELNEIKIALELLLKIVPSRNYRPDLVLKNKMNYFRKAKEEMQQKN